MRSKLFRLALFAGIFLRGCLLQPAFAQNPDLPVNGGSSYIEVGRGIPWGTTFNRTYLLVPNSPNASLCIYVVNNNPTSAHTFTTAIFQTADGQAADFTNNQGRYNSVPLLSMPASISALQMGSGFTQATAAAKIAVKFSAASTQAGSPDTADVFFVQTTSGSCGSASTSNQVQGTAAPGATATGNPIVVAGIDNNTLVNRMVVLGPALTGGTTFPGLLIGDAGIAVPGGSPTTVTFPNGPGGGPLAVYPQALNANGNQAINLVRSNGGAAGSGTQNQSGLFTANAGYFLINSTGSISSNTSIPFFGAPGDPAVSSCFIAFNATNSSGTTPTLNAYFQTSNDGINWTDRIAFTQLTTGSTNQFAGINSTSSINPSTISSGTLTAGTVVNGPIGRFGQMFYKLGGTSPVYTSVNTYVNCY